MALSVVFGTIMIVDLRLLGVASRHRPFARLSSELLKITWERLPWRRSPSQGMAAGKTLAELQDTLMLAKYASWAHYDTLRRDNIEAAYLNLKNYP